jgi:hypothetical protein
MKQQIADQDMKDSSANQPTNHDGLTQPSLNASSNSLYKQFFERVKKGEIDEVIAMVNQIGLDVANLYNDL